MRKNSIETKYVGKFLKKDYDHFKDGFIELLEDYKRKSERLDKIIKQSDKMQLRLLEANEQLDEYKNNLEKRVEEEIKKREEKERLLLEQSKFAAMGEMIDAIAHQWRQPLNILSIKLSTLNLAYEANKLDKAFLKDFEESNRAVIDDMNSTLKEFRTFFRPNKECKEFHIEDTINKVRLFVKDEFIKDKITIDVNIINNFKLLGVENEFKHIILNIINNARDAFISNSCENRKIKIVVFQEDDKNIIEISDNAGGIPKDIMDDIFKANFTTKEQTKGSGIGLYMSSLIAEKYHFILDVENLKDGAKFILKSAI